MWESFFYEGEEIFLGEKARIGGIGEGGKKSTQQREESDCSKRLSRYAPCYSQCSYPYSISPLGCLFVLIFFILLIGVDGKGY